MAPWKMRLCNTTHGYSMIFNRMETLEPIKSSVLYKFWGFMGVVIIETFCCKYWPVPFLLLQLPCQKRVIFYIVVHSGLGSLWLTYVPLLLRAGEMNHLESWYSALMVVLKPPYIYGIYVGGSFYAYMTPIQRMPHAPKTWGRISLSTPFFKSQGTLQHHLKMRGSAS